MAIPFVKPDIRPEDVEAVVEVLTSGWITTGPKTKQFERELSEYYGTSKTATMSSQTMAAEMTLHLLGIGPGDEVIVPAYTYSASCSIICHVGATPVLIDSKPGSFEMDTELLAAAITERTKAIIPVDYAGMIVDYAKYFEIVEAKKHLFTASDNKIQQALGRVAILADTAHSLGARKDGVYAGAIADFSNFSFHAVKNLTTSEGGAVTWRTIPGIDDEDIYKQFMLLSLHGQNKDALAKTKSGAWEYDIVAPYYKCNLMDITAALGLSQLRRYEEMLDIRHHVIETYQREFSGTKIRIMPHTTENMRSSAHLAVAHIDGADEKIRNRFIELMGEREISCNVHYKPLPMLTAYKNLGFDIKDFPNAYNFYHNHLTLPLYSQMTDEEVAEVCSAAKEVLRELGLD